ncbi:hypothetical protein GCM10011320_58440 [Neoroseomonas lacus]|uniref:Uncharacterized protein n=2 Tax=Neoroseomonas lacus TaxID=287609 RepID=A0A917L7F5_9PROT|nr:hypothetical protein GCM10011320_58440 [Neoroseomonas lacus]
MGFDIGVRLGFNLGPPGYAACPVELGAAPGGSLFFCASVRTKGMRIVPPLSAGLRAEFSRQDAESGSL